MASSNSHRTPSSNSAATRGRSSKRVLGIYKAKTDIKCAHKRDNRLVRVLKRANSDNNNDKTDGAVNDNAEVNDSSDVDVEVDCSCNAFDEIGDNSNANAEMGDSSNFDAEVDDSSDADDAQMDDSSDVDDEADYSSDVDDEFDCCCNAIEEIGNNSNFNAEMDDSSDVDDEADYSSDVDDAEVDDSSDIGDEADYSSDDDAEIDDNSDDDAEINDSSNIDAGMNGSCNKKASGSIDVSAKTDGNGEGGLEANINTRPLLLLEGFCYHHIPQEGCTHCLHRIGDVQNIGNTNAPVSAPAAYPVNHPVAEQENDPDLAAAFANFTSMVASSTNGILNSGAAAFGVSGAGTSAIPCSFPYIGAGPSNGYNPFAATNPYNAFASAIGGTFGGLALPYANGNISNGPALSAANGLFNGFAPSAVAGPPNGFVPLAATGPHNASAGTAAGTFAGLALPYANGNISNGPALPAVNGFFNGFAPSTAAGPPNGFVPLAATGPHNASAGTAAGNFGTIAPPPTASAFNLFAGASNGTFGGFAPSLHTSVVGSLDPILNAGMFNPYAIAAAAAVDYTSADTGAFDLAGSTVNPISNFTLPTVVDPPNSLAAAAVGTFNDLATNAAGTYIDITSSATGAFNNVILSAAAAGASSTFTSTGGIPFDLDKGLADLTNDLSQPDSAQRDLDNAFAAILNVLDVHSTAIPKDLADRMLAILDEYKSSVVETSNGHPNANATVFDGSV